MVAGGGGVTHTVDRLSKIVGRGRVGTINGFRGVPGGWVWRSGILSTVEALADWLRSQVVGALKALRVLLAGLAS
jgi:hypothetical protein